MFCTHSRFWGLQQHNNISRLFNVQYYICRLWVSNVQYYICRLWVSNVQYYICRLWGLQLLLQYIILTDHFSRPLGFEKRSARTTSLSSSVSFNVGAID